MTTFKLEPEQELRFEVENDEKIKIELMEGLAEMFGTELMKNKVYTFLTGSKGAIFTYHGCTLTVYSNSSCCYVSKETPMIFYLNIHGYLEKLRTEASEKNEKGPIVVICGPGDVGKTTLSKILLNYSVGCGKTPLYVDLDCGQGSIGIPGVIGCSIIERPADIETGFTDVAPLVLHFGDKAPSSNVNLYTVLITQLAEIVHKKLEDDSIIRESGVIVNTCGWITGQGYYSLLHAIKEFKADVILTIDQEKLYNTLIRDFPFAKVLFTPKSGGVVIKTSSHCRENREKRLKEYFYGSKIKESGSGTQFYPHSFDIPFHQLKIYQIGAPEVPNSCLPLGMVKKDHLTQLVKVEPSMSILNHILAVTFTSDLNEIIKSNIQGFICVTGINIERQTITVISPQPRPLPQNSVFLLSKIQYLDVQ